MSLQQRSDLRSISKGDERAYELKTALFFLKNSLSASRDWRNPRPHPNFLAIDLHGVGTDEEGKEGSTAILHGFFNKHWPSQFRAIAFQTGEAGFAGYKRLVREAYKFSHTQVVYDTQKNPLNEVGLWIDAQGIEGNRHAAGVVVCASDGIKKAYDNLEVIKFLNAQTITDRLDYIIQLNLLTYGKAKTQGYPWAQEPLITFLKKFQVKRSNFVVTPLDNQNGNIITIVGVNHTYPMTAWESYGVYSFERWAEMYWEWRLNNQF